MRDLLKMTVILKHKVSAIDGSYRIISRLQIVMPGISTFLCLCHGAKCSGIACSKRLYWSFWTQSSTSNKWLSTPSP